jgi:hypothetical protein
VANLLTGIVFYISAMYAVVRFPEEDDTLNVISTTWLTDESHAQIDYIPGHKYDRFVLQQIPPAPDAPFQSNCFQVLRSPIPQFPPACH